LLFLENDLQRMIKNYTWYNSQFFLENQPVLSATNRAFAYGDGLFETIHAFGTTPRNVELHYKRLINGIELLGMEVPQFLTMEFLEREITRLLNKNRVFGSARVRLTVFREEGGYYTPATSKVSIIMQAKPLKYNFYELNKRGLVIDFFTGLRKPINYLSSIKSCNALLYVMAGQHKVRMGVDDCLIINDQNRVSEAISSNLFYVVGDNIYTPSLNEGCVDGVMRKLVIITAKRLGLTIFDNASINPQELLHADEMFLTNAVKGIQWVVGCREKRFFNKKSIVLSREINRITFPDQFNDGFSG